MNRLMCELLCVSEHKRRTDGSKYYSANILIEKRVVTLFYNDEELYDNLSKLDRLSDICLFGEFRIKDEHTFIFTPQSFEM